MQFPVLLRNFRPRAIPLYIHTGLRSFWGAVFRARQEMYSTFMIFAKVSRFHWNFMKFSNFTENGSQKAP